MFFLILGVSYSQTALRVEFDDDDSLEKYLTSQFDGKLAKSFTEKEPYVQSATVRVSLNLYGSVSNIYFIESSTDSDFNNLVLKWVWSTSGKWEITNAPTNTDSVNIIIPFLQRTTPMDPKLDRLDLVKKYQDYHKSLTINKISGCFQTNCVILPEIRNYKGPVFKNEWLQKDRINKVNHRFNSIHITAQQ